MTEESAWYAIYTKPNFEKKVIEDLKKLGIQAYCPIIITKRKWSDRWKKIEVPLIRSIIFVYIQLSKEKSKTLSIFGVHRFLTEFGKNPIIPIHEIEAMKEFVSNSEKYDIIGDIDVFFQKDKSAIESIKEKDIINNQITLVLPETGIKITMKVEKQKVINN